MSLTITDNTKSIMDDLTNGTAFDTTMLDDLGAMDGEWSDLHTEQDSLFGTYSPIQGMFDGLEDSSSFDADDVSSLPGLTDDQKSSLVGTPKGLLTNLKTHATSQFSSLTDNLNLYATHQSVTNALGSTQGCGSLTDHFGTLMSQGQGIATAVRGAKNALTDFRQIKTQMQSEINSFDGNAIGILTGQVDNTILSRLVQGSGLYDQMDGILASAGITGSAATSLKNQVAIALTPNLNNFYNKKTAVNAQVKSINDARGGILGQVSKELTTINKATTTLRSLGAANSLQGLFKANECAQTLLGFVASSDFLGKLGQ